MVNETLALFRVARHSIGETEKGKLCRGFFYEQRILNENQLIAELALSPEYVDELQSEEGPHGENWLVVNRIPHLKEAV